MESSMYASTPLGWVSSEAFSLLALIDDHVPWPVITVASGIGSAFAGAVGQTFAGLLLGHKSWTDKKMRYFASHLPSLAHSMLSTLGIVISMRAAGWHLFDDMENGEVPYYRLLYPFSLGYFVFDSMSMWTYYLRYDRLMIAHHVAVMAGCVVALTLNICKPFILLALMAEPNSIFLHCRTVMRMLGLGPSLLYKMNLVWLFTSLLLFRIGAHGWGVVLTALSFRRLHPALSTFGFTGGAAIFFLNCKLLLALLRTEFPRLMGTVARRTHTA